MFGLAVLVALGLYVYLAKLSIQFIGKRTESKLARYATVAVFVLIPTWDMIPGRVYFQHLCEHEAGVKVLKTVELDQSYFRPDGRPDDKKLLEQYALSIKRDPGFSLWAHITKKEGNIQDKETGEQLGTSTDFAYYGGWLEARIAPMSPATCPAYKGEIFGMVLQQVFRLKHLS